MKLKKAVVYPRRMISDEELPPMQAFVSKHLALHRNAFAYGGRWWVITHRPTGYLIMDGFLYRRDARRVLVFLEQEYGDKWLFDGKVVPDSLKGVPEAVMERFPDEMARRL